MSRKRIFVFGLDGASWKIIDGFIKKGHLPFLKKITAQGLKKNLISTLPPRTAPAWASFISGQNPGGHGVFDFLIKTDVFGKKRERVVNGTFLENKFWHQWPKKKIGLINLPLTYPVEKINGVSVSSLLTPKNKNWFYPKNLLPLLEKTGYQIEDFTFLEKEAVAGILSRETFRKIKKMAQSKFLLTKELLEKENWDFFFLLFSETDWSQHLFWRGRQTLEIYKKIDSHLEIFYQILVKKYGARNFYFFLISDHGFHLAPKIYFNLYPWLRKNGFLRPSPKVFLARAFRKASFWEKDKNKSRYRDWGKTKILEVDPFGVWLNKKVLGKKYQAYRRKLIESLTDLKYKNGKRVFQLVSEREEVFSGKKTKIAWDVVYLINPYFYIGPCSIERKIFIPRKEGMRAIHDSDRKGILLAKGTGIKKELKNWLEKEIYIWDLAQIFNQLFGIKDKRKEKKRKIRRKANRKPDQEIIKRLKALGYVN